MQRLLLVFVLLAGSVLSQPLGLPYSISEVGKVDRLLSLLQLRLRISEEVARAKWNTGAAVTDSARESRVVEAFLAEAERAGADPALAEALIRAQIEASKTRQTELMAGWTAERRPHFPHAPDLAGEIRPRLDWLSRQMVACLAGSAPLLRDKALLAWRVEVLWGSSLDPAEREALAPLWR